MPTTPAASAQIYVMIVDDHQLVIEGIKTLLKNEAGIRVVAQASSEEDALRQLAAYPQVNVVILDLNMPQTAGAALIRTISADFPHCRVLALSMGHEYASVAQVLQAGGCGYLLKNTSKAELSTAIRQVAQGQTFFSPEVGTTLLANLQIPANRDSQPVGLTTREREILQLIAQEYSNSHIAEALFISERTVETHRKNILTKTNSKSVVGLIQYALRHKLIV
ncbi:response regulator transcription factor [Hymenobacter algoricola]|uniref:Response regulator transcription factor n=1 Tax=Hymenobacter algoricola TaxID=486267 RepID=A0ABP7NWK9_9BACT